MGLLGFLGKGLDLVSDFIPGANIVQSAIEAVVPEAKSFFEGTIDQPQQGGQKPHPFYCEYQREMLPFLIH